MFENIFINGASRIPPMGFQDEPKIVFDRCELPTATPCTKTLYLTIKHTDYEVFRDKITCKWCAGFKGSREARVINQHTKSSKTHLTNCQSHLYPDELSDPHLVLLVALDFV